MRLRGAVLHGDHVARFRRGRPGGRAARLPRAPAAVRRAAGSGGPVRPPPPPPRVRPGGFGSGVGPGVAGGAPLRRAPRGGEACPRSVACGGVCAAADRVFRSVAAPARPAASSAVAPPVALPAIWPALTAGYFWGALIRRAPPPAAADAQALSLGIVPAGTALGLVNLLFLVFVVIQLRYFFGGAELVQRATDLTYAEYARRGFLERCAAGGLRLPFLLV